MRKSRIPLRGSVTQNTASVRMRSEERSGIGFLTRLGLLLAALVALTGFAIWSLHDGWPQRKTHALMDEGLILTKKMQFAVKDITVKGRYQSSKDEILDALGTETGAPIFALDTKAVAAKLGKLPWIGAVTVERHLPDTVAVILTERMPAARWQHNEAVYVIDDQGRPLSAARPENFTQLPLVVGTGAEKEAQILIALFKKYPDIAQMTDSAVRVAERRWDLHLKPKITVRLPEENTDGAMHRLSVLINESKILERNIVAVDLRVPDRVAYEPATTAKSAGDKTP